MTEATVVAGLVGMVGSGFGLLGLLIVLRVPQFRRVKTGAGWTLLGFGAGLLACAVLIDS